MGTFIDLRLGGQEICSSKNSMGVDYGALFQESDRRRLDELVPEEMKDEPEHCLGEWAFVRTLSHVLPRLELLGYTLSAARMAYGDLVREWLDDLPDVVPDAGPDALNPLSFDELLAFVKAHPLDSLSAKDVWDVDVEAQRRCQGRFLDDPLARRIPRQDYGDSYAGCERAYFVGLLSVLSPFYLLRLLAECPQNQCLDLVWAYGDLVDNGWEVEESFVPGARRRETILIATEGSSDIHVLKHAFHLLRPDIEDFFRFFDVTEGGHPFSGAGNLVKFAQGLLKIDVQNRLVFLFDNDAEGNGAFQTLNKALPANMRVSMLPQLEEFKSFPCRGPEGASLANINLRAAAIECYLDLERPGLPAPVVTWVSYKANQDVYQGALAIKETYVSDFCAQSNESLQLTNYDTRKLQAVLDSLVQVCTDLASEAQWSAPC